MKIKNIKLTTEKQTTNVLDDEDSRKYKNGVNEWSNEHPDNPIEVADEIHRRFQNNKSSPWFGANDVEVTIIALKNLKETIKNDQRNQWKKQSKDTIKRWKEYADDVLNKVEAQKIALSKRRPPNTPQRVNNHTNTNNTNTLNANPLRIMNETSINSNASSDHSSRPNDRGSEQPLQKKVREIKDASKNQV
jgi:hypothetical protein